MPFRRFRFRFAAISPLLPRHAFAITLPPPLMLAAIIFISRRHYCRR